MQVAEGGIVPADGVLLDERCRVNEALLSGESAPVNKQRHDVLIAGSILIDGPAQLRIERVGADTALAGIAVLVGRAQAERPQLARAGERAATRFVARVLALTALTVVAWSFVDPARAFTAALAVMGLGKVAGRLLLLGPIGRQSLTLLAAIATASAGR